MKPFILLCIVFVIISSSHAAVSEDFQIYSERLFADTIADVTSSANKNAQTYLTSLTASGNWTDVNYADQTISPWNTLQHINRVLLMSQVYKNPIQKLYNNQTLRDRTILALEYWVVNNFTNPNKYNNIIGASQPLAKSCFLMQADITNLTIIQLCTDILHRSDKEEANVAPYDTGQNLIWVSGVTSIRGLIMKNETLIQRAFGWIWNEISVSSGAEDGIKSDASFFQHGPLLYSGGYGAEFAIDTLEYVVRTRNLYFSMNSSSLAVWARVLLDGHQWMMYSGNKSTYWTVPPIGRELTRQKALSTDFPSAPLLRQVPYRTNEFIRWADRLDRLSNATNLNGNRGYWKSEYLVHFRPDYVATVKMYSNRTLNAECTSSQEGRTMLKMSDGSFWLHKHGLEYNDIAPAWDWHRIPGTTSEIGNIALTCANTKNYGKSAFVGLLSDEIHGVAAMNFISPLTGTLKAKKSWFMFDDEIVALGTDIMTSSASGQVITQIDQKLLVGDVYTSQNPSTPFSAQTAENSTDSSWVHHDGVGYIFPTVYLDSDSVSTSVSNQNQTGNWNMIGTASGVVNAAVFNLMLKHNTPTPANPAKYQYIVVPSVPFNTFKQNSFLDTITSTVKVLQNDNQTQAVSHSELKTVQIVFWQPNRVLDSGMGWNISADKPCIIMVKNMSGEIVVSVSDPTQLLSTLSVYITIPLQGTGATHDDDGTTVVFNLPTGELAGSTTSVSLSTPGTATSSTSSQTVHSDTNDATESSSDSTTFSVTDPSDSSNSEDTTTVTETVTDDDNNSAAIADTYDIILLLSIVVAVNSVM